MIPRFVSANSLSSLRWWEDTFGQEYDQYRAVNWDTVPTLDCIVCWILAWAHSIPWISGPLSRWALSSRFPSASGFCPRRRTFSPSDKDSHMPLFVHLNPRHFTPADVRAQMRAETKMDSKARRKERQKLKKAQGAGATSGTTGTTSTAPPPTRVLQRRLRHRPVERQHL